MADNGAGAGIRWDKEVDWLVVGGGGAGMVSALTANHLGLDTLVIEKAPYMGGSTARSGGVVWIPNNYLVREGGLPEFTKCITGQIRPACRYGLSWIRRTRITI